MFHDLDLQHALVFWIGLLLAIKAAWALISPATFRSVVAWGLRVVPNVNTLLGLVYGAIGVALWCVVLLYQSLAHWCLVLFGFLFFGIALVLLRYAAHAERVRRALLPDRVWQTRLLGAAALVLALLALWIGLTDR